MTDVFPDEPASPHPAYGAGESAATGDMDASPEHIAPEPIGTSTSATGQAGSTSDAATARVDDPWWTAGPPATVVSSPPPRARRVISLPGALAMAAVAALVATGITLAATGVGSTTINLGASSSAAPAAVRPGSVSAIAATVLPSVVSITVSASGGSDTGSGIVLTSSGYVLTNNHVISAAASGGTITVQTHQQPNRLFSASIVGRDPKSDLAVLRVAGAGTLVPAVLGQSASLEVGVPVVAIGSPLGLAGTVTSGIVSALNRPVSASGDGTDTNAVIDAIQTDAPINPGNSGGPLVDGAGHVVGINSAIATLGASLAGSQSGSIGLGFAIPIDYARQIAAQLIAHGHAVHPVMHVAVANVGQCPLASGMPANLMGAVICQVTAGGPGAKAGLEPGDLVIAYDGQPITSADELVAVTRVCRIGSTHQVTYVRGSATHTVGVTLASDG